MNIGILGNGVFGKALGYVLNKNNHQYEIVGSGEQFSGVMDVIILAVPTQNLRAALNERPGSYSKETLFINCAKGIEKESAKFPFDVVNEVTGCTRYAVLGGPSFADEILAMQPTVVNIATNKSADQELIVRLLHNDFFIVEAVADIMELELAGAMKNVYAIAAGYLAGSGGGENIRAHLQVVALREYVSLVKVLDGDHDVLRPSVIGDLILTCASNTSRNFQYGMAIAKEMDLPDITAEGVHTAEAISALALKSNLRLPLAEAVLSLVRKKNEAGPALYKALGFDNFKL